MHLTSMRENSSAKRYDFLLHPVYLRQDDIFEKLRDGLGEHENKDLEGQH